MSFKSWALANPTKTYEYLELKRRRDLYQSWVDEKLEDIALTRKGKIPDWYQRPNKSNLLLEPLLNTDLITLKLDNAFRQQLGLPEIDKSQHKIDQWEREAVNAKEDLERAIKIHIDSLQSQIDSESEQVADYQKQMQDYVVDAEALEYRGRWDSYEDIATSLGQRLAPLYCDAVDIQQVVDFEETLLDICFTLEDCGANIKVDLRMRYNLWICTISDKNCSFTRLARRRDWRGAVIVSWAYALLAYLDYRWDDLIVEAERVNAD